MELSWQSACLPSMEPWIVPPTTLGWTQEGQNPRSAQDGRKACLKTDENNKNEVKPQV